MQIHTVDPLTYNITVKNACGTTSYGMELDLAARIMEGLTADGSFGYTHATFDKYDDGKNDYTGHDVPISPRFTAQIGLTYRHVSGIFARAEMQHFGKSYWDESNESYRSPYQLVNAKIGYETDRYDAYLYVKNVLDERYYSHYLPSSGIGIVGDPQRFGVELVYRF
jgi:iron complex outermembrane receptor protein